jgi:hypothetical protein
MSVSSPSSLHKTGNKYRGVTLVLLDGEKPKGVVYGGRKRVLYLSKTNNMIFDGREVDEHSEKHQQ